MENLADRYPFLENEIEYLLKKHEEKNEESTLFQLANVDLKKKLEIILDKILPSNFELKFTELFRGSDNEKQNFENLLEALSNATRRGIKPSLRSIYSCNETTDGLVDGKDLIELCFKLITATELLFATNEKQNDIIFKTINVDMNLTPMIESLQTSSYNKTFPYVSTVIFSNWTEENAPMLSSCLSTFLHHLIFPETPMPISRIQFQMPKIKGVSDLLNTSLIFSLACMDTKIGGSWERLYSYELDGRSFNRLQYSLLGYSGPVIFLVKSNNSFFGAFTNSTWKESPNFYGDYDCFLFQSKPFLKKYHPTGAAQNFIYCNSSHRSRVDGQPKGIGFGGANSSPVPRLFIPENMELEFGCNASSYDHTFEAGDLLQKDSLEKFTLDHLEVWAVGEASIIKQALQEREKYRDVDDSTIRRAKIVDKAAFLDDFRNGLTGNRNLFAHRDQARGRASFDVDREHGE